MRRVIVVASHRRSGTHLLLDSLRANAPAVRGRFMNLDRIEPTHPKHLAPAAFDRRLRSGRDTVLLKTHALPTVGAWRSAEAAGYAAELLASTPTIYVHRDGRDVLVSLYNYIRSYSAEVASMSFGEFIRSTHTGGDAAGLSRAGYWRHHVLTWLDHRPTTTASFEALTDDIETSLRTVAEPVGLELRPQLRPVQLRSGRPRIPGVGQVLRFLGVGSPLSTAIRPTTGRAGAWREQFERADLAWFDREAAEAMRRLGYRSSGAT